MITFRKFFFFIIFFLVVSFSACQQSGPPPDKKLKVVTTIAPLYSFAKNVAGETAIVENLLPSGVDPHEYSLNPADMKKIADAQIIIKNGINLELWLNKPVMQELADSTGRSRMVIDTSSGVTIIDDDPHIWLSPENAVIQVKNIRDGLAGADPAHKETYKKNAAEYISRLKRLDRDISSRTRTWKKKEFVAFHRAFIYFERDYGLKQVAVLQRFPGQQPSPEHIADVINAIKDKNINVIFTEPQISHKIIDTIASDLNLKVYSLDTLETGELSAGWYEDRMRANLSVLETALKGETE